MTKETLRYLVTFPGVERRIRKARAEGFRAARERAAGRYDKRAAEHRRAAGETSNEKLRLEHRELAEQWESEARDIRAMEDAGEGPLVIEATPEQRARLAELLPVLREAVAKAGSDFRPINMGEAADWAPSTEGGGRRCGLCGGEIGPDVSGLPMCYGCGPAEMDPPEKRREPPLSQLRAATERMEAAAKPSPIAMLGEAADLLERVVQLAQMGGASGLLVSFCQLALHNMRVEKREAESREGQE
jgi:hypothetical protein